mgnify:CR=1 FL=1
MYSNFRFISIFVFIILAPLNAIANEKIYFVDIDYILFNSIAGKKISIHIQNENKKINSELKQYNNSINKKKGELINQKNVLSKDEFNKKYLLLEEEIKKLNDIIKKKNLDLNNYKKNSRNEFLKKLEVILHEYAKDKSIQMILQKRNILLAKKELDVTKDVIELFDKNFKVIEVN